MNRALDIRRWAMLLLPLAIGAAAFYVIAGPNVLSPTNVGWLGQNDPAQHYLGWLFFRDSPWTFPLGLNPRYGLEWSSAIVFTDSNPLLALLFKPFAALLPRPFQYFGLWLLACFLLQAWFAWKLIALFSDSLLVRALGTTFFAFSPPVIWRYEHMSLMGHFLLLAALYLALQPGLRRRRLAWGTLLGVTALVHAYLLAMAGLLWLASLVAALRARRVGATQSGVEFATVFGVVLLACWQAGYFSSGGSVVDSGYGVYRANVLALFDPSTWSPFLKDIPNGPGDYEGFAYLGAGGLLLLVMALPAAVRERAMLWQLLRDHRYLALALLALALFAWSHRLGIGAWELAFPLPKRVLTLAETFRASGRMIWPVFYMVLLGTIYVLVRGHGTRVAAVLLALALPIQLADLHSAYSRVRTQWMAQKQSSWNTPLVSPFWTEAAARYTKLRWLLPRADPPRWLELGAYAGAHGLATDSVLLARPNSQKLHEARERGQQLLRSGQYEPDTLYVLDDDSFQQALESTDRQQHLLVRVDGFNVIAPGWSACPDCSVMAGVRPAVPLPPIDPVRGLRFDSGGEGPRYLREGWSTTEPWGVWTSGHSARLRLRLAPTQVSSLVLQARALTAPQRPQQEVNISINHVAAGKVTLKAGRELHVIDIAIPAAALAQANRTGYLDIVFGLPDAARPVDLGLGSDTRRLAIGLVALSLR